MGTLNALRAFSLAIAALIATGAPAEQKLSMATSWPGGPPLDSWAQGFADLVRVMTDGPLDPESLRKRVVVRRVGEEENLASTIESDSEGMAIRFDSPLNPGRYRLFVDPQLEDLAGNSVARPFNVDLTKTSETRGTELLGAELSFEVPSSDSE